MVNAFISGTGFYVPPRVVTNDDLITGYGIETTDAWIVQRTGIETRHYAAEGVGTAELPSTRPATRSPTRASRRPVST